ncbi:MAG: hypothetical protein RL091_236 [Verrucomicrobiota bacterium]|jgi:hypothetical protein
MRRPAGLSHTTVRPDVDFETYSEAGYLWDAAANKWQAPPGASQGKKGLPIVGAAVYAQHPSTEVLCAAYDLKDGHGKQFWHPRMAPPQTLPAGVTPRPTGSVMPPAAAVVPPPAPAFRMPPPIPAPARVMLPAAQGATYEQCIAGGWTDALLIEHKMMAA